MPNSKALISVVMSVYNGELYLDEAIQSILTQTYSKFEFIIIDDGSTDNSLEIIKKYKKEDSRIVLISRENRGLIYSLNEGISLAKGKYIARMDADDISTHNRFKEQCTFMEEHKEVGVCGSFVELFYENNNTKYWTFPTKNDELKTRLLFSVPVAHPSVLIRKSIIDKYSLVYEEEYKNAEDYAFWLEFSNYTKFANINQVLLKYRYLEVSVSRQADKSKNDVRYNTIKSIFTKVLKKLEIQNTEEENRLHFIIASNERMAQNNVNIEGLHIYIAKILKANKKTEYFNQKYLLKFLTKKFLIVSYYQLLKNKSILLDIVQSKYFYIGIYNIILEKIKYEK